MLDILKEIHNEICTLSANINTKIKWITIDVQMNEVFL